MKIYEATAKSYCFWAAMNNGLVRAIDGSQVDMQHIGEAAKIGIDGTDFEKFWEQFNNELLESGYEIKKINGVGLWIKRLIAKLN